jgi:pimeloyl-ACP methyl ester carboxylesterase
VAFLVNLSGSTVNSNDQEIQRTGLKLGADGFPAEDVRAAVALQRLKFEYACGRTEEAWRSYAAALERARGAAWLPDPYIGPPESRESSAWDFWRCGVEPARYWESISAPALLIYGEHETYAEPGINIARFERAMHRAGNRRFKVLRVPEAEHSMKLARTGGDRELLLLDRYQLDFFELQGAWLESQAEARP